MDVIGSALKEGRDRGDDAVESMLRYGCGHEAMSVQGVPYVLHSAVAEIRI